MATSVPDGGPRPPGRSWSTSRTEAFSDGVFAIAITLLAFDIRIPPEEFDGLWGALVDAWPSYLAFATSFLTIGALWLAHHRIFHLLRALNARLMQLNLLLLMAVSFLPFPTRLLAEAIEDPDAERAAVIFYGATLLVISVLVNAIWGVAARERALLRPEVTAETVGAVTRATTPALGFYAGVLVVALFAPHVAAFGFLVIAVVAVFAAYGERSDPAA